MLVTDMEASADEARSGANHRRVQTVLSWLALPLGLLNIAALYANNQPLVYLTKPGTMLVILTLAAVGRLRAPSKYANLVLIGLACSLVGDIFLMLPSDQFVPGLVELLDRASVLYRGVPIRHDRVWAGLASASLLRLRSRCVLDFASGSGRGEAAGDCLPAGDSDDGVAVGGKMEYDERSKLSVCPCWCAAFCRIRLDNRVQPFSRGLLPRRSCDHEHLFRCSMAHRAFSLAAAKWDRVANKTRIGSAFCY